MSKLLRAHSVLYLIALHSKYRTDLSTGRNRSKSSFIISESSARLNVGATLGYGGDIT